MIEFLFFYFLIDFCLIRGFYLPDLFFFLCFSHYIAESRNSVLYVRSKKETHLLEHRCPLVWEALVTFGFPPWARVWVWHLRPRWRSPCTQFASLCPRICHGEKSFLNWHELQRHKYRDAIESQGKMKKFIFQLLKMILVFFTEESTVSRRNLYQPDWRLLSSQSWNCHQGFHGATKSVRNLGRGWSLPSSFSLSPKNEFPGQQ